MTDEIRDDPQEVLDVADAAALLRVPRHTIYRLASQGLIPARKVGRHWRFRRTVLLAWMLTPGMDWRDIS